MLAIQFHACGMQMRDHWLRWALGQAQHSTGPLVTNLYKWQTTRVCGLSVCYPQHSMFVASVGVVAACDTVRAYCACVWPPGVALCVAPWHAQHAWLHVAVAIVACVTKPDKKITPHRLCNAFGSARFQGFRTLTLPYCWKRIAGSWRWLAVVRWPRVTV